MRRMIEISFSLCDHLNPDFGYQIRISDVNGEVLLYTSRNPNTGKDLLTPQDCLDVAAMYA